MTSCTFVLYAFFWVIPWRLNFICRRFGTLYLFHLHRQVGTYLPMKMEQTECSETSAYKIQTPGNYPEESIQPIYLYRASMTIKTLYYPTDACIYIYIS